MAFEYSPTLLFAREKDRDDPLHGFRSEFYFPRTGDRESIYFCGNSLGLQPKNMESALLQELMDWRNLAVNGYVHAKNPWLFYQHLFSKPLSKIAGCRENEVTVMNTLTVNLHLMLLSFYKPTAKRFKVIMEAGAFPSDQYALETQIRFHGLDPEQAILEIHPRPGEKIIREQDILESIERHGDSIALLILGGINYYSGQLFDIQKITVAAKQAGAVTGFDLAHAIGNVPLRLHDWGVDFAVWCSYKYLNAGPGAVGGVYIHEKHAADRKQPRMGGWWGNEESTRFNMDKGFIPKADASGWNISTAQVFNMVGLKASLEIFEKTNMDTIRSKSIELTAYLECLLLELPHIQFEIITPSEPERRGAQLSLYFKEKGKEIHQKMTESAIIVDYREPGVIRVAPAPLYNSFEDVYRFFEILNRFR
jgi:kynureninase